jgi:hypothetical protein
MVLWLMVYGLLAEGGMRWCLNPIITAGCVTRDL